MQPAGAFRRRNGEHVIVHRCLSCGFERYNRIAADDDFVLVLRLPAMEARGGRREASEAGAEWDEMTA
jgi:RNHCP domain